MQLPDYVYHVSFQKYGPLNCKVMEKGGFLAADL